MSHRQRRRRALRWMLVGSVLLHVLVVGLFFIVLPDRPPSPPIDAPG